MKEYLSIGELANIFGMDVQLLRYYDARGILVPSVRNEANGRRYYHFDQVYPLATIRYLRKLDYSLDQIGAFISSGRRGNALPLAGDRYCEEGVQISAPVPAAHGPCQRGESERCG